MDHIFINIKEPSDALQLAKKTTVRSHVARRQWKSHTEAIKDRKRKREEYLPLQIELNCSDLERKRPLPPVASPPTSPSPQNDDDSHHVQSRGQTAISPPPLPTTIEGFRIDPFRSCPVAWRPFLPILLDYYLASIAIDIPELDQPQDRILLRTLWFPLVMTDSCLFLVTMLIAASHYTSAQQKQRQQQHDTPDLALALPNLLDLRCEALQSINQAIGMQHGDGVLSDALIGAVAKMASYEASFGDLDNYTVHMQALSKIVRLRGGLESLGLDGLLRRIVVWVDRRGASLHGSMLYFLEESTPITAFPMHSSRCRI